MQIPVAGHPSGGVLVSQRGVMRTWRLLLGPWHASLVQAACEAYGMLHNLSRDCDIGVLTEYFSIDRARFLTVCRRNLWYDYLIHIRLQNGNYRRDNLLRTSGELNVHR
jgi:hypothetical protein